MSATNTSLVDNLDTEWLNLINTRTFADEVDEFIRRWPALEALSDDPRNACGPSLTQEQADEIFHALLAEHASGSYAAGRAVLQCMLPAVRTIIRRSHRHYPDPQDLQSETTAAMWAAITGYDLTHDSKVATRLMYQTLTKVVGNDAPWRRRVVETPTDDDTLSLLHGCVDDTPEPLSCMPLAFADLGPVGEVLDVIAWGLDARRITPDEASLLTRLYAPDPNLPEYAELEVVRGAYQARVANELGISHATLRKRASRAVRALAEGVQAGL